MLLESLNIFVRILCCKRIRGFLFVILGISRLRNSSSYHLIEQYFVVFTVLYYHFVDHIKLDTPLGGDKESILPAIRSHL